MKILQSVKQAALGVSVGLVMVVGFAQSAAAEMDAAQRFVEREAIEKVLYFANLGYEISDVDMFANAYAEDAVYMLDSKWPVFGYAKLKYEGRDDIAEMVSGRSVNPANPDSLNYNPATLRRFNRNSNDLIEIIDETHAKHYSNWMVVMRTNVDIHTSAVGRYEDDLIKRGGQWYILKRVRSE